MISTTKMDDSPTRLEMWLKIIDRALVKLKNQRDNIPLYPICTGNKPDFWRVAPVTDLTPSVSTRISYWLDNIATATAQRLGACTRECPTVLGTNPWCRNLSCEGQCVPVLTVLTCPKKGPGQKSNWSWSQDFFREKHKKNSKARRNTFNATVLVVQKSYWISPTTPKNLGWKLESDNLKRWGVGKLKNLSKKHVRFGTMFDGFSHSYILRLPFLDGNTTACCIDFPPKAPSKFIEIMVPTFWPPIPILSLESSSATGRSPSGGFLRSHRGTPSHLPDRMFHETGPNHVDTPIDGKAENPMPRHPCAQLPHELQTLQGRCCQTGPGRAL